MIFIMYCGCSPCWLHNVSRLLWVMTLNKLYKTAVLLMMKKCCLTFSQSVQNSKARTRTSNGNAAKLDNRKNRSLPACCLTGFHSIPQHNLDEDFLWCLKEDWPILCEFFAHGKDAYIFLLRVSITLWRFQYNSKNACTYMHWVSVG